MEKIPNCVLPCGWERNDRVPEIFSGVEQTYMFKDKGVSIDVENMGDLPDAVVLRLKSIGSEWNEVYRCNVTCEKELLEVIERANREIRATSEA